MKSSRYGVSAAFAVGLFCIVSCGSGDGGDDSAAAGKSSGGSGTGSTSGGGPGFPGSGGAMNNPACPATAPADATACTLSGAQNICRYTGASCACVRSRGGLFPGGSAGATSSTASRQWQCTETLVCPANKPTVGDACTPADGFCSYAGMGICGCSARSSKWACSGGTIGGGAGGAFSGFGGFPSFGGGTTGLGGRTGSGAAGDASGTTCPDTKPAADTACAGTGACPYSGGGCVCSENKWSCL